MSAPSAAAAPAQAQGRTIDSRGLARYAVGVAVLAGSYYGAARAGLNLAYVHGTVTALWPPVGVGVAALALFGPRLWPGIVVGDLLAADFSAPLGTVLGQTTGNTLEVLAAAILFRRLTRSRADLGRVWDVLALVVAAAAGALLSATSGALSLRLGDVILPREFESVWRTWWLSDFSGALVFAPVILACASIPLARPRPWRAAEGVALLAALVALLEVPSQRDVPFVVFPLLIWAGLRFGARGAAAAVVITSSLTVWNTAHGSGPFVRASITHSVLETQLFVAVAALTSLVLAAITAERAASAAGQRALAAEQASLRRIATHVARETAASRSLFDEVAEEAAVALGSAAAALVRYETDASATVVGAWSATGRPLFAPGTVLALDVGTALAEVARTREPQTVARYEDSGLLVRELREQGYEAAVAAPVTLRGQLWGALVVPSRDARRLPVNAERRLCDFAELVAQALANADAYEQLAASRARLVEASDSERRRLERNLHDGAQQRLVSLALQLRLARATLKADAAAADALLDEAQEELTLALDELRELARGIHPAILSDQGLTDAVAALAARAPVHVDVAAMPDERFPEPVEAALYYVVAEAITNVAKYAQATNATVTVARVAGAAQATIVDDGVGGADPRDGSGLRGLVDRVEALQGTLRVVSPPDGGTRIDVEIPVE